MGNGGRREEKRTAAECAILCSCAGGGSDCLKALKGLQGHRAVCLVLYTACLASASRYPLPNSLL